MASRVGYSRNETLDFIFESPFLDYSVSLPHRPVREGVSKGDKNGRLGGGPPAGHIRVGHGEPA
jgi:hypothetical protein